MTAVINNLDKDMIYDYFLTSSNLFFLIGRNPNLSWCKYYKENAESNFEIKGKFIKQAHW